METPKQKINKLKRWERGHIQYLKDVDTRMQRLKEEKGTMMKRLREIRTELGGVGCTCESLKCQRKHDKDCPVHN